MIKVLKWAGRVAAETWIRLAAAAAIPALAAYWAFVPGAGSWIAAAPPWLPNAFLMLSLIALCAALATGRMSRRVPEFISVYETHMDIMWNVSTGSLSWWLEKDLEAYANLEDWIIGPFHRKNGCMEQLNARARRGYAAADSGAFVPLVCPGCKETVYESEEGQTFAVDMLKMHTLKTLQRLHRRGVRIKNGTEFHILRQ